jgi:hypothetical protein
MITELEQQIRSYINRPRNQANLLTEPARWNQLCSALDVIGDTELAINAHLTRTGSKDIGESYLVVYGVLQVLLVQQDAVRYASVALGIPMIFSKDLKEIRKIRNDAIGHPVTGKENKIHKSNFMTRATLSDQAFTVMSVYSDEKQAEFRTYELPKLIDLQRVELTKFLDTVLQLLRDEEMKHRERHRSELLQDVFPDTLEYHFSKLKEATFGGTAYQMGLGHLDTVRNCLKNFQRGLENRGEGGVYDSVDYHINLLCYPIERLSEYFSECDKKGLNDKDAYIFATFVEQQTLELRAIAVEIDEDYASVPEDKG